MLLNHRSASLAPKQTQVMRRRHGEVDTPKVYPPPLRCAGCSARAAKSREGMSLRGWSEDTSSPQWHAKICSKVSSLLNCSEEPGQHHRLLEVPGNSTLLFSLCQSKQNCACQLLARRFPEWICGVPLHALCVYSYPLVYSLRSIRPCTKWVPALREFSASMHDWLCSFLLFSQISDMSLTVSTWPVWIVAILGFGQFIMDL